MRNEDSAHVSGDKGVPVWAVRKDTAAATGADGDYVALITDADGKLYVNAAISLDSIYTDDADWSATSSKHELVGGVYQSTPGSITDGDTGPFRVSANGALHIHDGGGAITVDGTVTANLSGTDNAVLDTIETNTDFGTVKGKGAVTSDTLRVTVASDTTGVLSVDDNGSTLSIDDGSGSITVDNGGTFATQATLQAGTAEVGKLAAGTASIGHTTNLPATPVAEFLAVGAVNSTTADIIANGAVPSGKRLYITDVIINCATNAAVLTLEDNDGNDLLNVVTGAAAASAPITPLSFNTPLKVTNTDKGVRILTGQTTAVGVSVSGFYI